MRELDTTVNTALDALQRATGANHDETVGSHIVRAIDALHKVKQLLATPGKDRESVYDSYELNEFNSAI